MKRTFSLPALAIVLSIATNPARAQGAFDSYTQCVDPEVKITNDSDSAINAVWYAEIPSLTMVKKYEASLAPHSTKTLKDGITYYAKDGSTGDKRNQDNKVLIAVTFMDGDRVAHKLHSSYTVPGHSASDLKADKKIKLLVTVSEKSIDFTTDGNK